MVRIVFAILFVVAGLFAFEIWKQRPGNLPSSFFCLLDGNHDGEVSYEEWAALRLKSDWAQREWDFRAMDCDGNRRLSWREYRDDVFKGRKCQRSQQAAQALGERPRSPNSFGGCWADPRTGGQTCVVGESSNGWVF
jgi:hypothetical protein